jgi:DNA-binding ferritin-like protein (Dps family)
MTERNRETPVDGGHADAAGVRRYPDNQRMFPTEASDDVIPESWQRFYDTRESILLDYSHNTARAYYADLQDIFEWAVARDKDVLTLTEQDIRQYCALLRRRKYSENTIRRRMVAWGKIINSAANPA